MAEIIFRGIFIVFFIQKLLDISEIYFYTY